MLMLKKFLRAIGQDWAILVTGGLSIPLTITAFWAETPLLQTLWAGLAITCLLYAAYRTWAAEYRRAESAEAKLADSRPWVTVESYSAQWFEDEETGREYLWETVHLVNRGKTPAVSIIIPEIPLGRRTDRRRKPVPPLGPGEAVDVEVSKLEETLRRACSSMPLAPSGSVRSLRLPFTIEYRGLDHQLWTTEHTLAYSVFGITVEIAHPNESQHWTDLANLDKEATE